MESSDFFSVNHQVVDLKTPDGLKKYHYVDQLPEGVSVQSCGNPIDRDIPTLLCIHGFPDLWYGWRNQIGPWVRKGYRVVVPDCPGYGGTYKPRDLKAYTPKTISNDLIALLDHLDISKVVVVAHDWGAAIAWRFCAWFPERVIGLVAASVTYRPPAERYLTPKEIGAAVPNFGYMEYFASDEAVEEIESRLFKFFNLLYQSSTSPISSQMDIHTWTLPGNLQKVLKGEVDTGSEPIRTDLMTAEELEVYLRSFSPRWEEEGSGMQGPLSYYKTGKLRFEDDQGLPAEFPSTIPVLFLHPQDDPTSLQAHVELMKTLVARIKVIPYKAGHWVMLERPQQVITDVTDWLQEIGLGGWKSAFKL